MLESCQETSKLSVDSFMDFYDHMVPHKRDFPKKIFEKVANMRITPPLVTFTRDITQFTNQGGTREFATFLKIFFQKYHF